VNDVILRHHITQVGQGTQPMLLAHGFGCDQQMWRFVAPAFAATHRVVLFDHIGCGRADIGAYDEQRHARIEGYADDVCDILRALDLHDVVYVGHSVSAMIGVLAALREPQRFARLVLVGPSPCYLNHPPDYLGGFEPEDIESLLDLMETNLLGWANYLAPAVMGAGHPEALTDELKASFCASDAYITRRFARATFTADHREVLPRLQVPALVIQVAEDAIAPRHVGEYVHARLPHSSLHLIDGVGHCPHLTHPQQTIAAIRHWLGLR
jgi:sigma-B regulation protein RsbQ